jgi:hypothetical protein
MFCKEKVRVATRAAASPMESKLSSVTVAMNTPVTMGTKERYT